MYKSTWLYIASRINMAVLPSAGYTTAGKPAIIPKIRN